MVTVGLGGQSISVQNEVGPRSALKFENWCE